MSSLVQMVRCLVSLILHFSSCGASWLAVGPWLALEHPQRPMPLTQVVQHKHKSVVFVLSTVFFLFLVMFVLVALDMIGSCSGLFGWLFFCSCNHAAARRLLMGTLWSLFPFCCQDLQHLACFGSLLGYIICLWCCFLLWAWSLLCLFISVC